ncbi:hypothetical protein [Bradyrhizobium sp.]
MAQPTRSTWTVLKNQHCGAFYGVSRLPRYPLQREGRPVKSRATRFSQKSSNELKCCALSNMPRSKSTLTGPMSMQPLQHGSIAPTQLRMQPSAGAETQRAKKPSPRTEAVRIAKARITRRNSLRKQRQAQKG